LITGVEAVSLGGMHMRSHLQLDPDAGLETFRSLLKGNRRYATLNALNLIDLIPKDLAARLRPEIQELAKLKYRSSADAERYVRDLSRNILKILPRADKS
jgi:hypothetical protein